MKEYYNEVVFEETKLDIDTSNTTASVQLEELDEKVSSLVARSSDNNWHCTKCSYGSKLGAM